MEKSINLPTMFSPVPEDEMAFALEYFVSAANGRTRAFSQTNGVSQQVQEQCRSLFEELIGTTAPKADPARISRQDQASLQDTFQALCVQYHGAEHLVAICARVLAFYFLMEETAGAVVAEWTEPDPGDERYVTLTQPVIQAIATYPLGPQIAVSASDFVAWIRSRRTETT
jgi:hypothetical protein